MDCTHENKKLVDWTFRSEFIGGTHDSTYECLDCGETFKLIDAPIIYDYHSKTLEVDGVPMSKEDYEIIKEKERIIRED